MRSLGLAARDLDTAGTCLINNRRRGAAGRSATAEIDCYPFLNQSSLKATACVGAVSSCFDGIQGSWMTKYDHLTALLILIVLGTAVTIKTTMSEAALHSATVPGRTVTIAAFSKSHAIEPARSSTAILASSLEAATRARAPWVEP